MFNESTRSDSESRLFTPQIGIRLCGCNGKRVEAVTFQQKYKHVSYFQNIIVFPSKVACDSMIQRHDTMCSSKCSLKNAGENYWISDKQKQCVRKVKELRSRFENSVSAGRKHIQNKRQAKDFGGKYDCVPACPQIKKFKLLKIVVVVSTGIYVGDVIGKSFQDSMMSLRDELWYPYED